MDRTKIPFIGLKIELLIWLPNQKVVRHLLFRNKSSILNDCTHFIKGKRIQNKGKKIMSKTLHKRFFSIKFFPWMLIATHFFYYEMFLLSFIKKYHFHSKHLLASLLRVTAPLLSKEDRCEKLNVYHIFRIIWAICF